MAQRLGFSPIGKSRPNAQELVLSLVVGDLVGEAKPTVGLGIEAMQGQGRQKDLEEPAGTGHRGMSRVQVGRGHWSVGRGTGDRAG